MAQIKQMVRCTHSGEQVARVKKCACTGQSGVPFEIFMDSSIPLSKYRCGNCGCLGSLLSMSSMSSGVEPANSGAADAPIEGNRPEQMPGELPKVQTAAFPGGLCLMKNASRYDYETKLLMLKIAVFENGSGTSKKLKQIKSKWMKEVVNLPELDDMEDIEKKKLSRQLFEDFVDFIYSKDNIHKTVDDLRALLRRLSAVEVERGSLVDIKGIPSGFIDKFFSADCPLFDNMKELVELYHDDSFRQYMKKIVDDAFTADMSGKTDGVVNDEDDEDGPAGSMLSHEDISI